MCFSSFDSNVCLKSYGKYLGTVCSKITRFTGYITVNEAAHTISLISPSKSSSSLNTSNSDEIQTSFILNGRETRFASGMERDRSDLVAIHSTPRNFRTSARKFWFNGLRPLTYPGSGYGYGSDHPYPYSVTRETNQT